MLRHLISISALLLVAPASAVTAQGTFRAIEIQSRERRVDGRQPARFTPYNNEDRWLIVDSVRGRALFATIDEHSGDEATVVREAEGDRFRITVRAVGSRPDGDFITGSAIGDARLALIDAWTERLTLPATRAWDLTYSFHPPRTERGARWTDTIALAADSVGERQALTGKRVSTIVGDTTLDGRRLWIVRDSASVQFDERMVDRDESLDTLFTIARSTNGVIVGRMIVDPQVGLLRVRDDTTRLEGQAELRYPDGRVFRKPARDEIVRHLTAYDRGGYQARSDSLERERRRHEGGMVIVPPDSVTSRLARADTMLRDSLVHVWLRTTNPDEWSSRYDNLQLWTAGDTSFDRRLDSLRVAQGDSAFALRSLGSVRLDSLTMRRLMDVLGDPALPFAFGINPGGLYEDLAQRLVSAPPAAHADTLQWACGPTACRMLAAQWHSASEPRLEQLGLLMHFLLDPRTWTDTLVARARRDRKLLSGALALLRPLPAPNDGFRPWIRWLVGPNVAVGFDTAKATAIRFTAARTGRDFVGELRRKLAVAHSDSATLAYEYTLIGLGELQPAPESVAAHFRSRSGALHTLAKAELTLLFAGRVERADSATEVLLQDQLIATALGRGKPWRVLDPTIKSAMPAREAAAEKTLLLADSLAPAVRAKWAPFVPVISARDWGAEDLHLGGTLFTITGVERVGAFARIGIQSDGRIPRRADEAPWLYAAATTYYLMDLNGEWVIVDIDGWIT